MASPTIRPSDGGPVTALLLLLDDRAAVRERGGGFSRRTDLTAPGRNRQRSEVELELGQEALEEGAQGRGAARQGATRGGRRRRACDRTRRERSGGGRDA